MVASKNKFEISEAQEEYLKIYHAYFVLKWEWHEIARHFDCSKSKVSRAIHWVIDNKLNIPSKHLMKGAIDAITTRMKENKEMYDREVNKKRYRDNQFIVSLMREMREDEKTLLKLQELYVDDTDEDSHLSAGQVLNLIKKASENSDTK